MKLATLKNATPDGRLELVSKDLTLAADVSHLAPTLPRTWQWLDGSCFLSHGD